MVSGTRSGYVNPIPCEARYKKNNRITLDMLCEAAFKGDFELLEQYLKSGDEDNIFNGDINMFYTDVNALHMAAMAGHEACVKLLIEAGADPHIRVNMPAGKDPKTGETARDKATKFGHTKIGAFLAEAEKSYSPGWYVSDGIGNNRKLYSEPKAASASPEPPVATAAAGPPAPAKKDPPLPVALVFPGQGSQYVGMLAGVKDIPEVKDMLATAEKVLGYDLLDLCLKGPEDKLEQTEYCQPAMFVGGLAGVAKLRVDKPEAVSRAQCVAGLSLGEYTALCQAGVLEFEDALRLVQLRGAAMQEAALMSKQAMLSVAGLEGKVLEGLCAEAAKSEKGGVCQVANALFPKGYSCAGTEKAVHKLKELAEKNGALQARLLKTSGGFHTLLMQPAQAKLQAALQEVLPRMKPPQVTVYANVNAAPLEAGSDPAKIVELLGRQLVSPVLWCDSVKKMIGDGVQEFYECGPQKQLKAMMKRIDNKMANKTTSMEV